MIEKVITNKVFRIRASSLSDDGRWNRVSYWHIAEDVEMNSGQNVQHFIDQLHRAVNTVTGEVTEYDETADKVHNKLNRFVSEIKDALNNGEKQFLEKYYDLPANEEEAPGYAELKGKVDSIETAKRNDIERIERTLDAYETVIKDHDGDGDIDIWDIYNGLYDDLYLRIDKARDDLEKEIGVFEDKTGYDLPIMVSDPSLFPTVAQGIHEYTSILEMLYYHEIKLRQYTMVQKDKWKEYTLTKDHFHMYQKSLDYIVDHSSEANREWGFEGKLLYSEEYKMVFVSMKIDFPEPWVLDTYKAFNENTGWEDGSVERYHLEAYSGPFVLGEIKFEDDMFENYSFQLWNPSSLITSPANRLLTMALNTGGQNQFTVPVGYGNNGEYIYYIDRYTSNWVKDGYKDVLANKPYDTEDGVYKPLALAGTTELTYATVGVMKSEVENTFATTTYGGHGSLCVAVAPTYYLYPYWTKNYTLYEKGALSYNGLYDAEGTTPMVHVPIPACKQIKMPASLQVNAFGVGSSSYYLYDEGGNTPLTLMNLVEFAREGNTEVKEQAIQRYVTARDTIEREVKVFEWTAIRDKELEEQLNVSWVGDGAPAELAGYGSHAGKLVHLLYDPERQDMPEGIGYKKEWVGSDDFYAPQNYTGDYLPVFYLSWLGRFTSRWEEEGVADKAKFDGASNTVEFNFTVLCNNRSETHTITYRTTTHALFNLQPVPKKATDIKYPASYPDNEVGGYEDPLYGLAFALYNPIVSQSVRSTAFYATDENEPYSEAYTQVGGGSSTTASFFETRNSEVARFESTGVAALRYYQFNQEIGVSHITPPSTGYLFTSSDPIPALNIGVHYYPVSFETETILNQYLGFERIIDNVSLGARVDTYLSDFENAWSPLELNSVPESVRLDSIVSDDSEISDLRNWAYSCLWVVDAGDTGGNEPGEPGTYDVNGNMLKSWGQLIADGDITVSTSGSDKTLNTPNDRAQRFSAAKKIVVDPNITMIAKDAFAECTNFTSIVLPSTVPTKTTKSEIGMWAFYGCSSLTQIVLPEGMYSIAGHTLRGCTNLTSVVIPTTVTQIFILAFCDCTSLEEITIPSSVFSISNDAFSGCTSLTTIHYSGTAKGAPWGAPNATVVP